MSTRPNPEDYRTAAEFRWASRLWRRRTGGSLWTTFLLAIVVGGLTGSAVLAAITVVGAVCVHVHLRRTR